MSPAVSPPSQPHDHQKTLRLVLACACLYALAWTLFPPLLAPSFPLDVVESLGWGREWQWGYYKHPPLPPIALHVSFLALGRWGPFALSQLCVALTLWLVWLTACRLVGRERAFIGTVLTMGVAFYTRPALEFNHNIAQMPFWAGICYFYLAAWQDDKRWQWLMLGLMAGLGLLSKYSIGLLLLCLGLFTVLSPARSLLRRPGPWLALAVMALVFAPHLLWLHNNDWLPFSYAKDRSSNHYGESARAGALGFLLTQLLNHLPLLLVLLFGFLRLRWSRLGPAVRAPWQWHSAKPAYLCLIALAPGLLLATLGMALGLRLRDMWGVPMWPFSGVLAAALIPSAWLAPIRPYLLRGIIVWLTVISVLCGLYLWKIADFRRSPVRSDWPSAALAQQAEATWNALSSCPLDTVASDAWTGGLVAIGAKSQPSVLIPGDPRHSPWATAKRLQQHGALRIWQLEEDADRDAPTGPYPVLDGLQGMRMHEGAWSIPWPRGQSRTQLVVQWRAYVPAACERR